MEILIYPLIAWFIMSNSNKDVKRGLRNNNPGNIRISGSAWKGKVPTGQNTDGAFEQFVAPEYGIRAMGRLLNNYIAAGYDTIEKIVNRYAPASDNNHTENYIKFVSARTGLLPSQTVYSFNVPKLVDAMIAFENGEQPYAMEFIKKSIQMV